MLQSQPMWQSARRAIRCAEPFSLLLEDGSDYAVFVVDRNGHVVEWGGSAERLFGYQRNDIMGKPFSGLFFRPEEVRRGEPENELRTADFTGCACADRWYVRSDGTAVSCLGVTAPLLEADGGHHCYVKLLRDFTWKQRPEEHSAEACACAEDFGKLLAIIHGCNQSRFANGGSSARDVATDVPYRASALRGRQIWN